MLPGTIIAEMTTPLPFLGTLLIAVSGGASATSASPTVAALSASAQYASSNDEEVSRDPRAFLLKRLKVLADSGRLNDPAFVAGVLGLHFTEKTTQPFEGDCVARPLLQKSISTTRYEAAGDIWYKTLPGGHPHVSYPAFTINPPFDGDVTPAISYEVTTAKYCTGGMALLKETSSRLTLSGLPAFSCIQKADDLLPTAEFQLGTDGYSDIFYSGLRDNDSGSALTLEYRAFFGCALAAELTQSDRASYRYARAQQKYRACLSAAKTSFCASHAPFSWADGETQDAMLVDGIRHCGGLQDFYDREPLTGKPPQIRPPDLKKHANPCD
jgi:hypothetical protein